MKRSLRSHEAKRVVVIHVPKARFIGRSPASFFMHCRCASFPKQKALLTKCFLLWRHHPESNWGIKVLQTSALPLGYGAIWSGKRGSNPPPLPWQGSALPNELFPHCALALCRSPWCFVLSSARSYILTQESDYVKHPVRIFLHFLVFMPYWYQKSPYCRAFSC